MSAKLQLFSHFQLIILFILIMLYFILLLPAKSIVAMVLKHSFLNNPFYNIKHHKFFLSIFP